jgi:hypothetical protein
MDMPATQPPEPADLLASLVADWLQAKGSTAGHPPAHHADTRRVAVVPVFKLTREGESILVGFPVRRAALGVPVVDLR